MKTVFAGKPARMGWTSLAFATLFAISGALGCGSDGKGGGDAAVTAKADAVQVTYYYLPG